MFLQILWLKILHKFELGDVELVFHCLQMVAKLHAILRPFLLRRMKSDVEHMLPRKKEIILYACMTEHQKHFQDLLINKTLENYLLERGDHGMICLCCETFGL